MRKFLIPVLILFALQCLASPGDEPGLNIPPDAPAKVLLRGQHLAVVYGTFTILKAFIDCDPSAFYFREVVDIAGGKIFQAFTITSNNGNPVSMEGMITASFYASGRRRTIPSFLRPAATFPAADLNLKIIHGRKTSLKAGADWLRGIHTQSTSLRLNAARLQDLSAKEPGFSVIPCKAG